MKSLLPRHPLLITALAATLLTFAGCSRDDDDDVAVKEPTPVETTPPLEDVQAQLAGIHDALPPELADRIQFHAIELEDGELAAAQPEGWESGEIPGSVRPPDDEDLGFHTRLSAGFSCAGACQPKDWADEIEENDFLQYLEGEPFTVERDQKLGRDGRLLIARRDEVVYLRAAWWREGARRYAFCGATLDGATANALAAFEKACRATRFAKL